MNMFISFYCRNPTAACNLSLVQSFRKNLSNTFICNQLVVNVNLHFNHFARSLVLIDRKATPKKALAIEAP